MTSNLKSAKHAIEAELSHAKDGAAYYAARVEALESTLHQLESVQAGESASSAGGKVHANITKAKSEESRWKRKSHIGARATRATGAGLRAVTNGPSRQLRKAAKRGAQQRGSNERDDLPTTGGEFWLKLVSDQPQSAVDIANAAVAALGIKSEQKEKIQKLKQRVSPALASLVSAQRIQDTGAGRERRFFRTESITE